MSVGRGGIWAIKAKDESVWCRMHESAATGKTAGKVVQDTTQGNTWVKIQVRLRTMMTTYVPILHMYYTIVTK